MKTRNIAVLLLSSLIIAPAIAEECADDSDWAAQLEARKVEIQDSVESQIDTDVDVTDSALLYENSDSSCDLGFSMPGLPDIGLGISSIDACELLTSVTSDMVSELNDELQSELDDTLASVVSDTDLSVDIDLEDVAEDAITGE